VVFRHEHGTTPVHGASALWMQTMGASLLVAKRCSLVCVLTAVHDGRCAHGLLYMTAVQHDGHEHVHPPRGVHGTWCSSPGLGVSPSQALTVALLLAVVVDVRVRVACEPAVQVGAVSPSGLPSSSHRRCVS
jgi:hypothetical protein